ncbi:glycosyltransferase family 4 protein [Candidatus Nanohalococcus occultus]|uniref:Glycosyltransferase n=1 Tax=Candidatus Nanohalococcus occultus TaxID=2978047 RepID=A0ABY8CIF5_9ARCH|nr:Glycosyltransferase [Candidatus Nanohaloarchaeota archaeon SVXNc]
MKPLFITWEYPPIKAGGIAAHCEDLATTLADQGHEPVVISYGPQEGVEHRDGVEIHRVNSTDRANDTLSWAMRLGHEIEQKAIELSKGKQFDLVHAHDWMAVPGATGIKKTLQIPMVFTIHSTQKGRDGIDSKYQSTIHNLEWYGTYEAEEVITVGKDFCEEVKHVFDVPEEKVNYIPNGVDLEKFDSHSHDLNYNDYALDWENIVLFVGRMYPQKGPGHLIEAMPEILDRNPEAKFVMCGSGATEHYKGLAKQQVGQKVHFPGYVAEEELLSLMKNAKMTVAPSVYEPFGIVPLEAAACRTATVGSYVGGMKDTIVHEYTGLHTYPEDSNSIAHQVSRALNDPGWSDWMGDKARERVEDNFRWEQISAWTTGIYQSASS